MNESASQVPAMATSGDAGQNVEADRASALCDERLAGGSNPADADAEVLKLRRALKEALHGWSQWYVNYPDPIEQARIAELRKLL